MEDDRLVSIDIFYRRGPVGSEGVFSRNWDDFIPISIDLIPTISRQRKEQRNVGVIESCVPQCCFPFASSGDTIPFCTWSDLGILGAISSFWSEIIPFIIARVHWEFFSCKKPARTLKASFSLGHTITWCPDLSPEDDIGSTSWIGKGCHWKKQCKNEKEFFHTFLIIQMYFDKLILFVKYFFTNLFPSIFIMEFKYSTCYHYSFRFSFFYPAFFRFLFTEIPKEGIEE